MSFVGGFSKPVFLRIFCSSHIRLYHQALSVPSAVSCTGWKGCFRYFSVEFLFNKHIVQGMELGYQQGKLHHAALLEKEWWIWPVTQTSKGGWWGALWGALGTLSMGFCMCNIQGLPLWYIKHWSVWHQVEWSTKATVQDKPGRGQWPGHLCACQPDPQAPDPSNANFLSSPEKSL